MIVQYRCVSDFSELILRGPGILEVRQGELESLSIEAPGELLNCIYSTTTDGKLRLGYSSGGVASIASYRAPIRYRLEVKELNKITVSGLGRVEIPDLDSDTFCCRLSGKSQLVLGHLTSDRLDVSLMANAQMDISGDVETQYVVLQGDARYNAETLVSDLAELRLTDRSSAQIKVSDHLTAYVGGQGALSYIGYPEVSKQGAGNIVRRRNQHRETSIINQ